MALADPITPLSLKPVLQALLSAAKKHGADAADTLATHGRSSSITVRDGALEDIDNSEGRDIGLRVMIGKQQACVSSSDMSDASVEALAERAVAMARLAPEDPYCGLAEEKYLSKLRNGDALDLFDQTYLSPAQLKDRALELEAAALKVKGVKQAEGATASAGSSAKYFMTSHGFEGGWQSSNYGLSIAAIAEKDGAMERDYDYGSMRFLSDLRSAEAVGTRAGQRTVARLGGQQLPSAAMPVLFDQRVSSSLVGAFLSAISGSSIVRGVSYLKDHLGKPVFGETIQITDNPHLIRGHGSRPFDGEGMQTSATALIENGMLKTWLLNMSSARHLGMAPTGHASRGISSPPGVSTSNILLHPGDKTPAELMADVSHGLLVSDMFGPSINANTGDYSVGVSGFYIKNGQIDYSVNEVTIAGNLLEIFKHLQPANDIIYDGAVVTPSILCEGLTLAGS